MLRRFLIALVVMGALSHCLFANEKRQGSCVTAAGTQSLGCTITVYITGTVQLATIYADNFNTPKANPFTADSNTGAWSFYAPNGRFDIRFSGGNPSITPAYTSSDLLFQDLLSLTTGSPVLPSLGSTSANIAQSGFIQMAPGDCLSWRNNANTLDNCLTENPNDQLAYAGGLVPTTGTTVLPAGNCVQAGPNNTLTTIVGACSPPISGFVTTTGSPTSPYPAVWTGATSLSVAGTANVPIAVLNNIVTVDGTLITTPTAALSNAACTLGCTIDMRGGQVLALGTFDPGTKPVTLLLGPYTYTLNQITLRRSLQIFGSGMYAANGTIIQATGGNSVPPFIIDQAVAAQGVTLSGFSLQGTVSNTTQSAFNLTTSNGGLWYSVFKDLYITGFGGVVMNFDAQGSNVAHQFDTFQRVVVLRTINGNYALQILGFANSLKFENCEFDGTLNTQDGHTNIFIGQGTQTITPPYNIKFDLVTNQFAGVGFQINGADAVSIDQGHFENVEQVFAVGTGAGFGSLNITIHDSGFFNNSGKGTISPGVGVGQGFIVKNQGATGNVSIAMIDSHIDTQAGAPDAIFTGNTGSIVSFGNVNGFEGSYAYLPVQLGSPNGFGTGTAGTAVTTTTKGGGTGPTTPQTVVNYIQVTQSGTVFWIPLVQ